MRNSDVIEQIAETPGIDEHTLLGASMTPNSASLFRPVSGLYHRGSPSLLPSAHGDNNDLFPLLTTELSETGTREELRLDVDGNLPQNVVSGTIFRALNSRVHWIAKLAPEGSNNWTGTVYYKNGDIGAFPYTNVKIQVVRSGSLAPEAAKVIFSGGGVPNAERDFVFKSPYYRNVEFEFDYVEGVSPALSINTHSHPNRPANLPKETLTIPKVFQYSGLDAKVSNGGGPIPIVGSGSDLVWSDMEMHDAMQDYWSRSSDKPQWAMWIFYAALHEEGTGLGGIMFDDIGGTHRQGTAIFTDSFISEAPPNDSAAGAWVERMKFWCAIHEMGHAFNLAHSWQKALGTPWIPLPNEPEARSFMNYPFNVIGGQTGFFSNFHYRFSNDELLFMRHAPEQFVQMGNADWFDHHAFEQANMHPEPTFVLELRANRPRAKGIELAPRFEFLEPVVIELKLTNVSRQPTVIAEKLLSPSHHLTVIIKRRGRPAREVTPYATYCWQPHLKAINPGESIYDSLFVSVGKGGWDIAEPGYYTIQVALHRQTEDIVSNPFTIRVMPPLNYEEEYAAQDFFSESVGRILTFGGSHVLSLGNDVMQEVVDRFPDRKVSVHCRVAQANALMKDSKRLDMKSEVEDVRSASGAPGAVRTIKADLAKSQTLFHDILKTPQEAAEILGNIDFNYYMSRLSKAFKDNGAKKEASQVLSSLRSCLETRKVKESVIERVKAEQAAIGIDVKNDALNAKSKAKKSRKR